MAWTKTANIKGATGTGGTGVTGNYVTVDTAQTVTGAKAFTGGLTSGGNAVVTTTDARLSDTRVPTDGTVTTAKISAGGLAPSAITGTAVITTDARLSDQRTPLDGSVTTLKVASGGLAPSAITGTAVVTGDSRLSDTRVPTDGTVTTAKIASAGLAPTAITGTAVITSDSRLADNRTPLDGSVTSAKIVNGGLPTSAITGTAVITSDTRLTNARTPTSHASTHTYGGGDQVAIDYRQLTATGTPSATTYLRGDGTWAVPPAAPVTSVAGRTGVVVLGPSDITGTAVITTDSRLSDARTPTLHAGTHGLNGTDQITIAESQVSNLVGDLAAKVDLGSAQTITGAKTFGPVSLAPTGTATSAGGGFSSNNLTFQYSNWNSGTSSAQTLTATLRYEGNSLVSNVPFTASAVYENSSRVFSPLNLVPVGGLSATGTRDATTFLRGDNTWVAPTYTAPTNMVTTDTTQTISGAKTFSSTLTATSVYEGTAQTAYRVYSPLNKVPLAGLTATGTTDATTFLRGDNTWQALSGITGLAPSAITGTAVITTDSRLSDTRTPTDGTVTTAKVASAGLAPSAITGTAVITADTRLSDARTPTDASVTTAKIAVGGIAPSAVTGTAVITTDTRLSNARTPTAHASTHTFGGTDPITVDYRQLNATGTASAASFLRGDNTWALLSGITLAESQVTNLTTDLAAKYSATNKVPIAGLSTLGTADTTTYLRGDGTWTVPPSAPVTSVAGRTGAVVLGPTDITGTAVITTDTRLSDTRTPTDGTVTLAKIVTGGLPTSAITGTAVITTDTRLSDTRTPTDGTVTLAKIVTGGLAPSAITGTAVITSDTRLSDTRTPTDGTVTTAKIASGGVAPTAVTGTAVITTDSRLSDTRTPTDGTVTTAKIASGGLAPTAVTGTAVITTDSRLADARTPTAHATTHTFGGTDQITVDERQVTNLVADLAAKYSATNLVPVPTGLAATGTKDATTYLRGDGTWVVPTTDNDNLNIMGAF